MATSGVSLIFILIGVLGTFVTVLPERLSIWSYVVASAILLLGIVFRRI